ncbi:hypothetical protein PTTG_11984 [Puccinia triticina 1-1 BBBD Race 1]|uniref:Uncharacterized protein n=1 Tax=Puccinia triticina (isolate 1-1 / race 1 (BBBD)) TaxID=630390 RepID=A0A180GV66_PUCT1|nr:hypothetical protein PTTG_11984 [Puccinia triticina 1-1 BBBD Race 1]
MSPASTPVQNQEPQVNILSRSATSQIVNLIFHFQSNCTRTKRSASIQDHHNRSKRLQPNGKRRTAAILSFSSHSSKAIEWASGKAILSKKKISQVDSHQEPSGRSLYNRLYAKFKAVSCSGPSCTKSPLEEPEPSQFIIKRNQSSTSRGSVKSPSHLGLERGKTRKPIVMKLYDSQIIYVAESCVHCNHKCENKPDRSMRAMFVILADVQLVSSSLKDPQLYGLRVLTAQKSAQNFDQLSPPVAGSNAFQFPPPIPWQTRPIPTRPFRPSGEYDEEMVKLNVSNRLPPLPCSPTNKRFSFPVSDHPTKDIGTITSFSNNLQAQEYRKSDGYASPKIRLYSTFSEPTATASPSLSTSQRSEHILGSNDYSLPTGERYIFSSSKLDRQDRLNLSGTKKNRVISFPSPTSGKNSAQTRAKLEFRPTRQVQSWNSLLYTAAKRRESAIM